MVKTATNKLIHTFWSSLGSMGLHRDVCIQVIKCAVSLLTTIPAAFVHSFNFFIATTRALMLLSTWDGNKRINLTTRSDKIHSVTV